MGIISILMSLTMGISQVAACGDNPDDSKNWFYVGCRPSPGECRASCPSNRSYRAEMDDSQCSQEYEPWACYCPRSDYAELE